MEADSIVCTMDTGEECWFSAKVLSRYREIQLKEGCTRQSALERALADHKAEGRCYPKRLLVTPTKVVRVQMFNVSKNTKFWMW